MPFVYMLRCSDGSLYIGHSDNIASRVKTHNDGFGARYTAERRPVTLVHSEEYGSTKDAIWRERQLKRWTSAKKEALIAGDFATLKRLTRSHQQRRAKQT